MSAILAIGEATLPNYTVHWLDGKTTVFEEYDHLFFVPSSSFGSPYHLQAREAPPVPKDALILYLNPANIAAVSIDMSA